MTTPDIDGAAILAQVEAKRGYTLPYHRLFARHAPALLRDYDRFYESLTLEKRLLTPVQRETVWAGLLAAAREVHGFIHMRRATAAGMTNDDIARAVAIAAATEAFAVIGFSGTNWAAWTLPEALTARYLTIFDAARDGLDPGLAHLVAAVAMAARRERAGTVLHLARTFQGGITPGEACEGLSYMLIPCGGNTLIEAVAFWEEAAKEGVLPAPY
ncbi:carboxymuconolactone decarboxylase family protein [Elioraea rosea]|uniref:carboxymuconolactone decarboxylase family protein n=1 Tax=Elioraea rosea TaxID=2492390 RepID=UPI001182F510|nr:carboxymuconolactone decarboxylase family protein [Elioraea rosea]